MNGEEGSSKKIFLKRKIDVIIADKAVLPLVHLFLTISIPLPSSTDDHNAVTFRSGVGHEVKDVFKGQMNQTKQGLTLLKKDTHLQKVNKLSCFESFKTFYTY